jgi:signal transduction histidine kinase
VLAAQEEERGRIARELHDEVGQVLTGVMLGLEDPDARESVRRSLEDVRRIAGELRPQTLDERAVPGASTALISFQQVDCALRLIVRDDGRGLEGTEVVLDVPVPEGP